MKDSLKQPLVSIITVVFNAEFFIESTINSIIDQTYERKELIVIDGASTDSTLDIIGKYSRHITKLISEKDDGIYSAMNKGIALASGDWIIFMNAGDIFIERDVLTNIFSKPIGNAKVIYGDVLVDYGDFSIMRRAVNINKLWSGM